MLKIPPIGISAVSLLAGWKPARKWPAAKTASPRAAARSASRDATLVGTSERSSPITEAMVSTIATASTTKKPSRELLSHIPKTCS